MISTSERGFCPDLQIGEMPTPYLLRGIRNDEGFLKDRIAIRTYSVDGNCKPFFWITNVSSNLSNPEHRRDMARRIARIRYSSGIDITYGPSINYNRSILRGDVVVDPNPEITGRYVEASQYDQFRLYRGKMPTLEQLLMQNPDAVWTLIDNASTVLPREVRV